MRGISSSLGKVLMSKGLLGTEGTGLFGGKYERKYCRNTAHIILLSGTFDNAIDDRLTNWPAIHHIAEGNSSGVPEP